MGENVLDCEVVCQHLVEPEDGPNIVYTKALRMNPKNRSGVTCFVDFDTEKIEATGLFAKKAKYLIIKMENLDFFKLMDSINNMWKSVVKVCFENGYIVRQYHLREIHFPDGYVNLIDDTVVNMHEYYEKCHSKAKMSAVKPRAP